MRLWWKFYFWWHGKPICLKHWRFKYFWTSYTGCGWGCRSCDATRVEIADCTASNLKNLGKYLGIAEE